MKTSGGRRKRRVAEGTNVEDAAAVTRVLRAPRGWTQREHAQRAGIHPSALSKHEGGGAKLPREQLERLAAAAEVPLAFAELFVASDRILKGSGGGSNGGDLAAEIACRLAALLAPALPALASRPARPEEPVLDDTAARAVAAAQWVRLAKLTSRQRRLVIEHGREYQTEALCARLCDESEQAAAESAAQALDLAELARRVAELAPGSAARRALREGYAWGFIGNGRRVANLLPAADAAFATSRVHQARGAGEESGLLDRARVLDREASLRRNQGRTAEALELHERALRICRPENYARLLLNQAATFGQMGQPFRALAALREARPAIDLGAGGSRFRWLLLWNLAKSLLQMDRPAEAEALLPELQASAAEIGKALDLLRTRWMEARIADARGRAVEALTALRAVREEFAAIPLPADAA